MISFLDLPEDLVQLILIRLEGTDYHLELATLGERIPLPRAGLAQGLRAMADQLDAEAERVGD